MNWVSVGALLSWTIFDVGGGGEPGGGGVFTFLDDEGGRRVVDRHGRSRLVFEDLGDLGYEYGTVEAAFLMVVS